MGDFGLTGKSGGTSIFMAPEGLNKDSRVVVKTDLYSFSMTVLFLLLPVDLALELLFIPIEENLDVFKKIYLDSRYFPGFILIHRVILKRDPIWQV